MSDPPYALFVLDKSITNEVSVTRSINHVSEANSHSTKLAPYPRTPTLSSISSNNSRYIGRMIIKRSTLNVRESPASKIEVASVFNIVWIICATAN
jgi:hypothetical protein